MTNSDAKEYLIVSVKHPGNGWHVLFWGPNFSGYVHDLKRAGRYTREEAHGYLGEIRPWDTSFVVHESEITRTMTVVDRDSFEPYKRHMRLQRDHYAQQETADNGR